MEKQAHKISNKKEEIRKKKKVYKRFFSKLNKNDYQFERSFSNAYLAYQ